MRNNEGPDLGGVVAVAWIVASLVGVLYSFWILFGALVLFIWALVLTPHSRRQTRWGEADQRIREWQDTGGPRPSEEDCRLAAQWYMCSDWLDWRSEDIGPYTGTYTLPFAVRPYIRSEKELPRRYRQR